jgi:hypothetical protein
MPRAKTAKEKRIEELEHKVSELEMRIYGLEMRALQANPVPIPYAPPLNPIVQPIVYGDSHTDTPLPQPGRTTC